MNAIFIVESIFKLLFLQDVQERLKSQISSRGRGKSTRKRTEAGSMEAQESVKVTRLLLSEMSVSIAFVLKNVF